LRRIGWHVLRSEILWKRRESNPFTQLGIPSVLQNPVIASPHTIPPEVGPQPGARCSEREATFARKTPKAATSCRSVGT
jgi:hypothetical protein